MSHIGKFLCTHAVMGANGKLQVCAALYRGSYLSLSMHAEAYGIELI